MDVFYQQLNTFFESLGLEIDSPPFVITAVIIVFLVLWILLRGLRLWYWKTNQQLDTLKQIDERLKNLAEGQQFNGAARSEGMVFAAGDADDEVSEEKIAPDQENEPEPEPGNGDVRSAEAPGVIRMSMSKSGRIYTEEELDRQIKE